MELIQVLPDSLKSAATTAQWEEKLRKVERGELDGAVFLSGIVSLLRELVGSYRSVTVNASALTQNRSTVVGICPRCGRNVIEERNRFCCEGCYDGKACGFVLWKDNRFFTGKGKQLTKRIVEKLLKDGRVHMTKLHSEKKGTDYDADVVMEDTGGKYVNFRLEFNRK